MDSNLCRRQVLCILICLIISENVLSVSESPETVTKWKTQCLEKITCSSRIYSDNELSPDRFLHNYSCHCDSACVHFGDCCMDFDQDGNWTEHWTLSDKRIYTTCETMPEIDRYSGVFLISSCPTDWRDSFVRKQCESSPENDTLLKLPVVKRGTHMNYKNLYCSICHGERDFLYWKVETCCKNSTDEDSTFGYDIVTAPEGYIQLCETIYLPPNYNYTYRQCHQSVSTCPLHYSDDDIVKQCLSNTAVYVHTNNVTYKNIYCAVCNNVTVENIYCAKPNQLHHDSFCHGKKRKLPYSFKVLLDMNTNCRKMSTRVGHKGVHKSTVNITRYLTCPGNAVYDPFMGRCRGVWCPTPHSCLPDKGGGAGQNPPWVDSPSNCSWIRFNQTEYEFADNGSLFVEAHHKYYHSSQFRLLSDFAVVCVPFTQNYTEFQLTNQSKITINFGQTQVYLSLVGLILSLVALAAQLIVYAVLPSLRNVPGQNLMCLVSSLFLAELLFLVAPSFETVSKNACVAVAILMHFGFLAAFCWMQIMSFDIWYTFSRKSLHSPGGGKSKSFWFYQIYGWLTPAVLVLVAVCVEFYGKTDFTMRPWYGHGICWIANRGGLLLFFGGPVAVIVISNIIFFILTVRSIKNVDKSTSMVQNSSDKRRFFLYVKLCFLMGVAWIFGFLAAFTDVQALWYLFVILNTLQGVFICVAFVCTRKVYRLLKEKFTTVTHPNRERGTVSSSTGKTSLSSRTSYAVVGNMK